MTPKEQKVLTAALQANRRTLSLLDTRVAELTAVVGSSLEEHGQEDQYPFFYVAEGVDGQAGVPFTPQNNREENPAFGYVRMQADSAFVLTAISFAVTVRLLAGANALTTPFSGIGLRMYDESSSRWLTFTNQNNSAQQKTKFPSTAFSSLSALNEGGLTLPAETVFPRSAIVRIEVYETVITGREAQSFDPSTIQARAQVVFSGRKVYGG